MKISPNTLRIGIAVAIIVGTIGWLALSGAEANKSYLGCDFWPTVTMNSVIYYTDLFNFAVAVANTGTADALVTVTGGGLPAGTPTHVTVTPGALQTIKLPWVDDLRQSYGQQKSVQVTKQLW